MISSIDHLVVTAPRLDVGEEFVRRALGAEMQIGGCHPKMGTHNRVLRLGEGTYLEVIAPDPEATPPDRPRWFALDDLQPDSPPRLATWVARTESIDEAQAACPESLGEAEAMSRGDLSWRITIPRDGRPAWGGVLPAFIQWNTRPHPAAGMRDAGCALEKLELHHHSAEGLQTVLASLGVVGNVEVMGAPEAMSPALIAHIRTPHGLRTLGAIPGG